MTIDCNVSLFKGVLIPQGLGPLPLCAVCAVNIGNATELQCSWVSTYRRSRITVHSEVGITYSALVYIILSPTQSGETEP